MWSHLVLCMPPTPRLQNGGGQGVTHHLSSFDFLLLGPCPDPSWISGPLHPFISLSPFPVSEVPHHVAISLAKPHMSSVTKDATRLPAEFFVLKSCHWPFPDTLGHL